MRKKSVLQVFFSKIINDSLRNYRKISLHSLYILAHTISAPDQFLTKGYSTKSTSSEVRNYYLVHMNTK